MQDDTQLTGWSLNQSGVATIPGTAFAAPERIRVSFATGEDALDAGAAAHTGALGRLGPALQNEGTIGEARWL
jgi:aspartate/methionine/tyrosine aminotransferase